MNDTLTPEQIEQGYTMRVDFDHLDEWYREIYKHPSGRTYALIHGSLHHTPILYTLSRTGEPEYPIRINGQYVTEEQIIGTKKDLFEYYEEIPENLAEILERYAPQDHLDYSELKEMLQEVEALGFTFDYGLDAQPYGLRKL